MIWIPRTVCFRSVEHIFRRSVIQKLVRPVSWQADSGLHVLRPIRVCVCFPVAATHWVLTRQLHILWRTLSLSQLQFLQRPAFYPNFHFYSLKVWESNGQTFRIFLQQVGGFFRSKQPEITFKLWAFKPDNSAQSAL